jgi:hypothetical protein
MQYSSHGDLACVIRVLLELVTRLLGSHLLPLSAGVPVRYRDLVPD